MSDHLSAVGLDGPSPHYSAPHFGDQQGLLTLHRSIHLQPLVENELKHVPVSLR